MQTRSLLIKSRLLLLQSGLVATMMHSPLLAQDKTVASFETEECLKSWTSVNDGVMGGVSKGGFKRSEKGTLIFSGELSLENNGGFASIRSKPKALELAGMSGIVVKARGDGRTYWLDLRVKDQMSASSYRAYLTTAAGEWKEFTVPFTEFKPQAFGQELPLKPIDPEAIASVGFTLADKKAGPFELEIEYVKATAEKSPAVGSEKGATLLDAAKAAGGFKTLLAAATAAELVGVLSGDGPFTVLAPTDEAFAKLPAGTLDSLLKPGNREQLVEILKNHVIAGKLTLPKALDAGEVASLQGSKIAFKFESGRVRVGASTLIKADIAASNGIIHVIDQVLIPSKIAEAPLTSDALIELAIKRGVPLFNKGDAAACAAVYEITCEALRAMEGVSESTRKALAQALKSARAEPSARQQAWILRGAIDGAWVGPNEKAQ